jgi:hypothetical protein
MSSTSWLRTGSLLNPVNFLEQEFEGNRHVILSNSDPHGTGRFVTDNSGMPLERIDGDERNLNHLRLLPI